MPWRHIGGSRLFCTLSPVCKANAAFQSEALRLWQVKYANSPEIWSGQQHLRGTAATSGACHRPCVENRERATGITGTYHLAYWHPSSRRWWRNNEGGVRPPAERELARTEPSWLWCKNQRRTSLSAHSLSSVIIDIVPKGQFYMTLERGVCFAFCLFYLFCWSGIRAKLLFMNVYFRIMAVVSVLLFVGLSS